jgi:hypothetical protein
MELLGLGKVYNDRAFSDYRLYKAGSAQKHAASDDVTLKTALQKALNADVGRDKEDQGEGVFRHKINDRKGYVVYRVNHVRKEAVIFHYHWNYTMDLPLSVN